LLPIPAWAETWEDFQNAKAADEKSEVVYKGDTFAISKDVIVTRLTGPGALTQEPSVAFSSDLIFFDPGSWTIKERSRGQLMEMAAALSHPSFAGIPIVVVEGHTCSIGSEENNLKLSQKRAASVVEFLVKHGGIAPAKLRPQGFGESSPIASNESPQGRRVNRRVVLKVPAAPTAAPVKPQSIERIPTAHPVLTGPGNRRALLVGIEEYKHPEKLRTLNGVRQDVELTKKVLTEKAGFATDQIRVLLDRDATRDNVAKNFKDWLIKETGPGDTVLFYFSGHGIQTWDENGDETDDGMDEVLMCWDSNVLGNKIRKVFNGRTGYAFDHKETENILLDDDFHELIKQLSGRTVIFISDSCHSGSVYKKLDTSFVINKTLEQPSTYKSAFGERTSSSPQYPVSLGRSGIGEDLRAPGVRLVAFTASEDSQPAQVASFDKEPRGFHSVFTWHLFHGLNGRADLDGDGQVTADELAKFLKTEIKSAGFIQNPQDAFQPRELASLVIGSGKGGAESWPEWSEKIAYSMKAEGDVSQADLDGVRTRIGRNIPFFSLSSEGKAPSCLVTIDKRDGQYALRLSDATGNYWDAHHGSTLDACMRGLLGNLKAHWVQKMLQNLHRPADPGRRFDLMYLLNSPAPRAENEIVGGDSLAFRVETNKAGYLYVFSVDSLGVIHPLFPYADAKPVELTPEQAVSIGTSSPFVVQEPFGRELVFAVVLKKPMESLGTFWNKDDVGHPEDLGIEEQAAFLDALRKELERAETGKDAWASRILVLTSFAR